MTSPSMTIVGGEERARQIPGDAVSRPALPPFGLKAYGFSCLAWHHYREVNDG